MPTSPQPRTTDAGAAAPPRPSICVRLRPVTPADLPALYEIQLDDDGCRMAGVIPRTSEVFHAHWARILADPSVAARAIMADGALAGSIGVFRAEGLLSVGYWIGQPFWNRGIATRALALLLTEVRERPLHARVAVHNAGSLRVLERNGFVVTDRRTSPATDRYLACEEFHLRLG